MDLNPTVTAKTPERRHSSDLTDGKVGIMGAGLVGTYLGGLLSAAGRDVVMVGRGRTQGAIAKHGLTLTHYRLDAQRPQGFLFATDASVLAGCSTVVVTVKSQGTSAAARELAEHLSEDALVISFQNSLGNVERLREHLPFHTVLAGVVPFNVTSPAPGTFHQGTEGALLIERSTDPRVLELQSDLVSLHRELDLREDIRDVQWGKLILNLNNPLNALSGGPLRAGLAQWGYRRVLARMVSEALRVADAAAIHPVATGRIAPRHLPFLLRLPSFLYVPLMDLLLRIDPYARSSTLDDLEAGRGSENDHLQGEVVRLGRRHGVDVSTNARVMDALEDAFAKGRSPDMSGREMARAFLR